MGTTIFLFMTFLCRRPTYVASMIRVPVKPALTLFDPELPLRCESGSYGLDELLSVRRMPAPDVVCALRYRSLRGRFHLSFGPFR